MDNKKRVDTKKDNKAEQQPKKQEKAQPKEQSSKTDSNILYSINSVKTQENSIIVDFNVDISQKDINAFELKNAPPYRDVFDIKGYFKDALATKLSIKTKEKITIGQFKPDTLRIVVSSDTNPNTTFKIVNKRQLQIDILANKSDKATIKEIKAPVKVEQTVALSISEERVDTKNSIRSISSNNEKIVIKFNKAFSKNQLKHNFYKQNNKYENIFDITGKYAYVMPTKLSLAGIEKIITTENANSVRIRMVNGVNSKILYSFTQNELTIWNASNVKNSTIATPKIEVKNKTIVIDAGHGGDDVGAIGPNKRYEKVVNLKVAQYLENILKQRGYKVYLTRTNDKFIKVIDRTVLANKKNADLFISIHTNSIPKEKANSTSGIETFFLSPARSERAKRVAAQENKNDIREMSESSKSVFLESLNRPRITASHKFAIDVQAGLLQAARSKYKNTNDSGVREGPFWVLVGAQMPSILVELGYISHPEESKRLYEKDYQQLLANGIANGIDSYFLKNP